MKKIILKLAWKRLYQKERELWLRVWLVDRVCVRVKMLDGTVDGLRIEVDGLRSTNVHHCWLEAS